MNARGQKGFALLLLLTIVVLAGTTLYLALTPSTRGNDADAGAREKALTHAARAVIAYAAATGESADRAPGALVCPDTSHPGDVVHSSSGPGHHSPGSCGANVDVVMGRLPIRTLGLDPRSADTMEEIWYAIDRSYRDRLDALPINPETSEGLAVNGVGGFAAVLLVPSSTTPAQSRPSADPSDYFSPVNTGADTANSTADAFTDCSRVPDDDPNAPCGEGNQRTHERAIGIGIDELFDPVQRRVLREVENAMAVYRDNNDGSLPRAAPLGTVERQCSPATFRGYLPLTPPSDEGGGATLEPCWDDEYLDYAFPEWMLDYNGESGNDWFRFTLYHVDCDATHAADDASLCPQDNPSLQLDSQAASAVIAGTGRPLDGQTRPGSGIDDYLDHPENQDPADGEYLDFPLSQTDNDAFRRLSPE